MIHYIRGNLFDSRAGILVNAVNTVGVMGKGIALQFKQRYPEMFKCYKQLCETHQLDIGKPFLWKGSNKHILLFPTKKHWRDTSRIEYIESGLRALSRNWDWSKSDNNTIAFSLLGCGLGGLNWNDVQPLMEKYLNNTSLTVYIYNNDSTATYRKNF